MSGAIPTTLARRKERLVNLFARGRALQYANAQTLMLQVARRRLPAKMGPATELVYTAGQVVFGFLFIEMRGYLDDALYDPFTDAVFDDVAAGAPERLRALVETYASLASHPPAFRDVFTRDLCAATLGVVDANGLEALSGTLASLERLTRLYCAMVFDDAATVRALQ